MAVTNNKNTHLIQIKTVGKILCFTSCTVEIRKLISSTAHLHSSVPRNYFLFFNIPSVRYDSGPFSEIKRNSLIL